MPAENIKDLKKNTNAVNIKENIENIKVILFIIEINLSFGLLSNVSKPKPEKIANENANIIIILSGAWKMFTGGIKNNSLNIGVYFPKANIKENKARKINGFLYLVDLNNPIKARIKGNIPM